MSPDLWMLVSFGICLLIGMPVAFALGLGGAIGIIMGYPQTCSVRWA